MDRHLNRKYRKEFGDWGHSRSLLGGVSGSLMVKTDARPVDGLPPKDMQPVMQLGVFAYKAAVNASRTCLVCVGLPSRVVAC